MTKRRKIASLSIDEKLCKGCNICVELCAKDVFTVSERINRQGYYVPVPAFVEKCTGCLICELICPELAVVLELSEAAVESG